MLALNVRRVERLGHFYGSTHQSLQRGRVTEIDYLNGEVVRLSEQLKIAAPFNAGVVRLVHQVEQSGEFLTVDALRTALDGRRAMEEFVSDKLLRRYSTNANPRNEK